MKLLKKMVVMAILAIGLAGPRLGFADTTTTRWAMTVIDVGSTNWGPKLNVNTNTLDNAAGINIVNAFTSTNSFNAVTTFNAQLQSYNGTAAAPAYSSALQTNKGMWFDTNILGFSVAGSTMAYATTTALVIPSNSALTLSSGTATDFTMTRSTAVNFVVLSTEIVNTIRFSDGSTFNNANTGLVSTLNTTISASTTTTATTFVRSSLSRTYALRKSTNQIVLLAAGEGFNNTAADGCQVTFTNDDTNIITAGGGTEFDNPSGSTIGNQSWSLIWPYSPGDTSSHTYRVAFRAVGGGTCGLNSQTAGSAPIIILDIGQ